MVLPLSRRSVVLGLAATAAAPSEGLAEGPGFSLRPLARPGRTAPHAVAGAAFEGFDGAKICAEAGLSGQTAFALADLTGGRLLDADNPQRRLPPASVAKIFTALYALEILGPAHRFDTRLVARGRLRGGRLEGDLVLLGGGDPTLTTDGLADLAAGLKQAGVFEVTGDFVVDASALVHHDRIDDGQLPQAGYNPAVSGMNLNLNRVHFQWRRDGSRYQIVLDAPARRHRPRVSFARMMVVERRGPVYAFRTEAGREEWSVARGALGRAGARWLPVRHPELYAGEVFATLARSHGIVLPPPRLAGAGGAFRGRQAARALEPGAVEAATLARIESPPLEEIVRSMLKRSTNLTAEILGMTASRERLGHAVDMRRSAAEMSAWVRRRLGVSGVDLVDHSGLGPTSRVTAGSLVVALLAADGTSALPMLMPDYRLRDRRGREIPKGAIGVRAKTGTLHFVSNLAGYLTASDGRRLAFAILAADMDARRAIGPMQRERPPGGRAWIRRARGLQQELLRSWGGLSPA